MFVMLRVMTVAVALAACGGGGSSTGDGGGGGDAADVVDVCPATQPTPVAVSIGFVADDQYLYYYEADAWQRRPIAGGAVEKVADAPDIDGPAVLGGPYLFYTNTTQVMRVAKTGGIPEMIGTVPDRMELATDGTAAYVSALVDANTNIEVWRADGTATKVTSVPAIDGFSFLRSDGTHVYWFTARGELRRVPVGGGTVENIADSGSTHIANIRVTGFSLTADELVWSAGYQSFPDGNVFAIAKQAGTRRELSHTGYPEDADVVDGIAYVPVNSAAAYRVVAIPLAGGPRTVVGCLPERIDSTVATAAGVFAIADGQVSLFPL